VKPFDPSEQATGTELSSPRLQSYHQVLWTALVPRSGECASIQGEMIRAVERLRAELLRNGMGNYYDRGPLDSNHYGKLLTLVLDTLARSEGSALSTDDVGYFAKARSGLDADRIAVHRLGEMEEREDASDAERELAQADADAHAIDWNELIHRAERCVANWCIAHPQLVDRRGQPVEERGHRDLRHVFEPPRPPPVCPLCNGKGFIQPTGKNGWPKPCKCA